MQKVTNNAGAVILHAFISPPLKIVGLLDDISNDANFIPNVKRKVGTISGILSQEKSDDIFYSDEQDAHGDDAFN